MDELKEKYIQFCCDFYNEHAPEDKLWFGRMFEQCQEDYEQQNRCMYRWQFPLMILKDRQAEVDQLKTELALCCEENKGLVGKVSEQKKRIDGALSILKCFWVKDGDPDFVVVVDAEKALRGGDQNTKNKAQSIEKTGHEGGDQKPQQCETAPTPKWTTIKVVCHRCGHYLNGCHCNHFGDQCPHLNTSMFGENGLAECFNCNKIINKDREVVGGVDDINLTR